MCDGQWAYAVVLVATCGVTRAGLELGSGFFESDRCLGPGLRCRPAQAVIGLGWVGRRMPRLKFLLPFSVSSFTAVDLGLLSSQRPPGSRNSDGHPQRW
ncbi:hypothetical protein EJ110_NYTH34356 [Nymphaea thermarum]|nr:hypothetical protein EJ110_NYTH34356 [Nymphaea thermarum]